MSFFTNNKTGNTPIAEDSRARDDELVRLDNRLRALEGGGGVAGRGVGSVSASTGQGPPGPPGEPGPPGPPGVDGADGLSAYEVAVDNGFTGTEVEWLESLEGEQGDRCIAEISNDGSVVLEKRGDDWATALSVGLLGNEFTIEHDLNSAGYIVQVTPVGVDAVARVLSKGVDGLVVECSDGTDPMGFCITMVAL